jgi:hypothetical protein
VGPDGLFAASARAASIRQIFKIDQLMPIVAEGEQIADRQNSYLKSRAQIFDGSGRRFFVGCRKELHRWISALP